MTAQSNGNEDRLDRVERLLEQLVERQIHTDNRLDRLGGAFEVTDRLITSNAKQVERNSRLIERNSRLIERNSQQIAALSREIGFLRAAVQGHISQSTPPAHPD